MPDIGTDIIEIDRIEAAIQKPKFQNRVFTQAEQAYFTAAPIPAQSAAGLFCAKEAIAKALGIGFGDHLAFTDIEIMHTADGAPYATIKNRQVLRLSISISHCRAYATATAIVWEA